MPKRITYQTVTGETRYYYVRTGPKGSGHVRVQVRIPPAYVAAMEAKRDRTGLSVNEQIRRAIRMSLTEGLLYKPVYTGSLK